MHMKTRDVRKESRQGFRRWDMPVFWKHFVLMTGILGMAIAVLFIYSSIMNKQLRDDYMREFHNTLDRNCQTMSAQMNMIYVIPELVESSDSYAYLNTMDPDYRKIVVPLYYSRQKLLNQATLYGENLELVMYFSKPESIITRHRIFSEAKDCFAGYIHFSEDRKSVV